MRTGRFQLYFWLWLQASGKVIFLARPSLWPQSRTCLYASSLSLAYDLSIKSRLCCDLTPPWCQDDVFKRRVKGSCGTSLATEPFTSSHVGGTWATRRQNQSWVGQWQHKWGTGILWNIPAEASWKRSPRWLPWCYLHHPPGLDNPVEHITPIQPLLGQRFSLTPHD